MNTRSHSVKKPGPVLRGTLSHAIRREFPTPHPISEFSSRTDKSASSPGCSSSAKLGDLAAGSSCRERMAPRYREAFVAMSPRRSISVSELQHKDFCRCDALVWEGGCASCIARACKRMVSTGRGVREGGYEMILGSKSSLESGSHLTLLT